MTRRIPANSIATYGAEQIGNAVVLTQVEARRFLDAVFAAVGGHLRDHGEVTIPEFGKFTVRVRKARAIRHPKTREPVALPANVEVRFSAAADLTARLSSWLTKDGAR